MLNERANSKTERWSVARWDKSHLFPTKTIGTSSLSLTRRICSLKIKYLHFICFNDFANIPVMLNVLEGFILVQGEY